MVDHSVVAVATFGGDMTEGQREGSMRSTIRIDGVIVRQGAGREVRARNEPSRWRGLIGGDILVDGKERYCTQSVGRLR